MIKIYSTPTCTYCNLAKQFFTQHNVQYEEFNVAADANRRNEMMERSGQLGVPVIIVPKKTGGEEVIVGFQEDAIRDLLGL